VFIARAEHARAADYRAHARADADAGEHRDAGVGDAGHRADARRDTNTTDRDCASRAHADDNATRTDRHCAGGHDAL